MTILYKRLNENGKMKSRLPMASDDSMSPKTEKPLNGAYVRRMETQARFDRLWLTDAKRFDPLRNCLERERVERTWQLLLQQRSGTFENTTAVDLGCGWGIFARKLCQAGAQVDAVDISNKALKTLESQSIKTIQDYLPHTSLPDDHYDVVTSTEVLGYLPPQQHRLYFSELARLVKNNGVVVCSSALDINTDGAAQLFGSLAETEFQIHAWCFSYHLLYIRIKNFLTFPERMAQAAESIELRKQELADKQGLGRWWCRLNSSKVMGLFWKCLSYPLKPIIKAYNQSRWLLLKLESLCKFMWSDGGISHAIFVGKRRPLLQPTPVELLAIEPKHKKQVWE